jgi:O-antigen ligase
MAISNKDYQQNVSTQKPLEDAEKKPKRNQQWQLALFMGIIVTLGSAIGISYLEGVQKFYVLGILFGLSVAVVLFFRPYLGAYLIIFTTFTNLSDLFTESGLPSINQPLVAALLLVVIANVIFSPEKLVPLTRISRIEWALIAYFFVVSLSFAVAENQETAYLSTLRLLKNIVIVFTVFITLNTRRKIRTAIDTMIVTSVILSLLGIFVSLTNSDFTFWGLAQQSDIGQLTGEGAFRYGGPIGLANVWGQVLVVLLPYYIYRFLGENNRPIVKGFMLFAIAVGLLAIVLTGSRGAFVALLVITPIILIELNLKSSNIITLLGIGILIFVLLPTSYTGRFLNLLSGENEAGQSIGTDEAVLGRIDKMRAGIEMTKDHPFLGVGIGNYGENYWEYAEKLGLEPDVINIQSEEGQRDAHSLYIEIASETGLFGLATFLLFVGFLVAGVFKVLRLTKAANTDSNWRYWLAPIYISMIAYLVSGVFLHGIVFRWWWIIAGLALSAIHLTEERFRGN